MAKSHTSIDLSPDGLSRVIDAIYESSISSSRWHDSLCLLADLCASPCSFLAKHDYATRRNHLIFSLGHSDDFIASYEAEHANLDPLFDLIQTQAVGTVKTRSMMVDDQDYHDSRFFREWVNPQGLGDSIGFPVLKTERHFGCWIASRREISPRYRERDVGLLASLAPDVCRAFQLRVIVRNQEIQLNGLKSCLGVLASGVCLIDRYAHIIYMNTSAERQIKAGRGFCVERGRITPVDSEARHLFGQAITDMFAHHDQNARMTTVAIPDGSRVGVVATLLPLHLEKDYLRDVADGVVALFMQDPLVAVTLPGEAFSKLYELTDCERRVLLSLVSGSCVKATAELLGVSETTVKSHLSHIFSKTQTSKQAELIQLFLSFVPPIHSAKAG